MQTATIVMADGMPLNSLVIAALLVGALLLVGVAVWLRGRSRTSEPLVKLGSEDSGRPVAAERLTVDAPVAISENMSLREVKQAKSAKLSGALDAKDLIRAERERRRTTVGSAVMEREEAAPVVGETTGEPDESGAGERPATPRTEGTQSSEVTASAPSSSEGAPAPVAAQDSGSAVAPMAFDEGAGRSLSEGLARTRGGFMAKLGALFQSQKVIDDALIDQVEEVLFTADIGVKTAEHLMKTVHKGIAALDAPTSADVWQILKSEMLAVLQRYPGRLRPPADVKPWVVLMVGVNGAGKTTTIGKLAARWQARGSKVLMVAADTFRAAAVDQLEEWSRRVGCGFHRGVDQSDPSGVIFDGVSRAVSEGYDIVLVDTAGRLQTKKPLMDELQKIVRTSAKVIPGTPHETVLVLDANTGQNGIQQARLFAEAAGLSGLILTKLDGTAKGGVAMGVSQELSVPVYYVGIGEAAEDLREFDAREFVEALF